MSDWDAERYHRVSNPQLEWGLRVLRRLGPQPGERILDIGCGTGRLTAELVAAMGEGMIVAVDRSEAMLREAASQAVTPAGPHRIPNPLNHERAGVRVYFVRADGAALPFVDMFDAVMSTATFHWILDHDQLFASIYRALAPGGRLVAQCGGGANLGRLLDRAGVLAASPALAPYFHGWGGPWKFAGVLDTIERLDKAGFTAIDVSASSRLRSRFPIERAFGSSCRACAFAITSHGFLTTIGRRFSTRWPTRPPWTPRPSRSTTGD